MSKVEIVATRRPGFLFCVSCGAEVTGRAIFEVRLDGQTEWLLCPACAEAGPEAAAERMQKRATGFKSMAERLAEVAEGLKSVDWPDVGREVRLQKMTEPRTYTPLTFSGRVN